jgi:hypothetical protein
MINRALVARGFWGGREVQDTDATCPESLDKVSGAG